jgi:hypothetical protein
MRITAPVKGLSLPRIRSAQTMPDDQIVQAVQLLDLMIEHFANPENRLRGGGA